MGRRRGLTASQTPVGQPVCTYCKATLDHKVTYVAIDPSLGLPTGVGVRVCTPACPRRPDGVTVTKRR